MAVTYQDYYDILGVSRNATQEQIQSAYRKQARRHHPDVSKTADAEDKFKQINEAYEVLRDPEKRRLYDELGPNWRAGQDFVPPRGSANGAGPSYRTVNPEDFGAYGGDFSDFFSSVFGEGRAGRHRGPRRGRDVEAEITVSLEEAYHGGTRTVTLRRQDGVGQSGQVTKDYEVRIPAGIRDGAVLRLAGQGQPGDAGGETGDLFLRVRIARHSTFRVDGANVETDVAVSPWEAALGAEIPVQTLDGGVTAKLPAGTNCGKRLKLKGQGWPEPGGRRGDLFARVRIEVPPKLSEREHKLFEELRQSSDFDPRAKRR